MSVATASTFLFVPGDRPDRFARALASGADVVVCDLEDAVGPAAKDEARDQVAAAAAGGARVAVRVNAVGTPWHDADVAVAVEHGLPVVLPKADLSSVSSLHGRQEVPMVALVETARGLLDAAGLAALAGVDRLALGHLDLAAELGVDPDVREVVDAARTTLVVASAAAGLVGPVDGVTPQVRDTDRLAADAAHAARLGLRGTLCIHPAQVAVAAAAHLPAGDEVAWAERVLAGAADGVALVDGRMVDAPVLARARQVLARTPARPAPLTPGETP